MTDSNHLQHGLNRQDMERWRRLKNDAFDRQIDAALAKCAAVEPRAELEARVLANLRIERQRAARRSWWQWPAAAALATVIVLTVSLLWKSAESTHDVTAQHPPAPAQTNDHAGTQIANHGETSSTPRPELEPPRTLKPHAVSRPVAMVVFAPKLDQFPSPQPLSEQETILARYVTKFPDHAALIAQARTEELWRDSAEEMGEAGSAGSGNSKPWNK